MQSNKLSAALAILCLLGAPAAMAGECGPDHAPGERPVMVSVDNEGNPVVSPDSIMACEGDEVRWVFRGNAAKEFAIFFTGGEGNPCEPGNLTGATVLCTIKKGAAKNQQQTEYKYDVEIDGRRLDPTIIIDP